MRSNMRRRALKKVQKLMETLEDEQQHLTDCTNVVRGLKTETSAERSERHTDSNKQGELSPVPLSDQTCDSDEMDMDHINLKKRPHSIHMSLLQQVLTNQEIIMDQMKMIYAAVQGLQSAAEEDVGLEPDLLPLADRQSVEHLEERIRDSPNFRNQLMNALALKGGGDVKECVKRIMAATFTHSMAKCINMRGVNGKIGFQHLQLKEVVIAAVRQNRLTSLTTDQEIETRITKWLQNAPDRNGGRSKRMKRKYQMEECNSE